MRAAVSQASTQQDSPTSNVSDAEQLMPSAPDSDTYVPPGKRDTGTDRAVLSADGRRTARHSCNHLKIKSREYTTTGDI